MVKGNVEDIPTSGIFWASESTIFFQLVDVFIRLSGLPKFLSFNPNNGYIDYYFRYFRFLIYQIHVRAKVSSMRPLRPDIIRAVRAYHALRPVLQLEVDFSILGFGLEGQGSRN